MLPGLIALRHEARGLGFDLANRVATTQAGSYVSAYKGRGIDFEETRIYQVGDDFRTVDWRVTARTGEPHTKVFREERERPVLFLVDQGESLKFGTRGRFKSVTAARAAALLTWAAVDSGDRVGGVVHAERRQLELRPSGRRLGALKLIKSIVAANDEPGDAESMQSINVALARLGRLARPGTAVYLISDFRHWDDSAHQAIRQLAKRCDLIAIVVYDSIESHAPAANLYAISNGREFAGFDTRDRTLVGNYEEQFQIRLASLKRVCRSCNAGLITLNGVQAIAPTLKQSLWRRARRRG